MYENTQNKERNLLYFENKVMGGGREAEREGEWDNFKDRQSSSDFLYYFCGIKINF